MKKDTQQGKIAVDTHVHRKCFTKVYIVFSASGRSRLKFDGVRLMAGFGLGISHA